MQIFSKGTNNLYLFSTSLLFSLHVHECNPVSRPRISLCMTSRVERGPAQPGGGGVKVLIIRVPRMRMRAYVVRAACTCARFFLSYFQTLTASSAKTITTLLVYISLSMHLCYILQ